MDARRLLAEDPEAFVRKSLLDQLAVLHVVTTTELLGDDPEVIHDFRVAIRTLRSNLAVFAPYFKKPAKIAAWAKELKWLDGYIQKLRDIEVQVQLLGMVGEDKLQNLISKPSHFQAYRKQVLSLQSGFGAGAAEARAKMAKALGSNRKTKLFVEISTGLLLAELKQKKIKHLSSDLHGLLNEQVVTIAAKLAKSTTQAKSFRELHSIRLDCKRARYLAEAIGSDARDLAVVQDLLGQINDLANLNSWLKARLLGRRRQRKIMLSLVQQTELRLERHRAELGDVAAHR
jgi:CHAD domain-containing protein